MDETLQENEDLKKRLKEMTAEAVNNETILKRTLARELTLLRAESLTQLPRALVDGLRESHSLDAISVVLLDPQHEIRHLLLGGGDRPDEFKQIFFVDSLVGLAPQLAVLHKPWLGPFVGTDHHLLFPGSIHLKSAALVPLPRKDRATGTLCFGSRGTRESITRAVDMEQLGHVRSTNHRLHRHRRLPCKRGHHSYPWGGSGVPGRSCRGSRLAVPAGRGQSG